MKIEKVEIQGFRGIKHLLIDDFKSINLFFGKNNSGKTSILESIFLILGPTSPILAVNINVFRSLGLTEEDDFKFIFNNLDFNNKLSINAIFDSDGHDRNLQITPNFKVISNNLSIKNNQKNFPDLSTNTQSSNGNVNGICFNYSLKERHKPQQIFKSDAYIFHGSIEVDASKTSKYKEKLKGIYLNSNVLLTNLSSRAGNIAVQKSKDKLIKILKQVDSSIADFELGPNNVIFCDIGINELVPINILGDGIIKLFAIFVAMADNPNGFVLIDEIENGLHYSSMKTLWRAIIEASKLYSVQLFITTHNAETLKYLNEVLEEDEFKDFQEEVNGYTIRRLPDGSTKAYLYDFEKFEHAIELGIEMR